MSKLNQQWNRTLVWAGVLILMAVLSAVPAQGQLLPGNGTSAADRPIRSLADLNTALIDIVADVKPAVVTVSTERTLTARLPSFGIPFGNDDFFDFFFGPNPRRRQPEEREYRQQGLGSGVIVSDDGYILTNNHVVRKADTIFVRTWDGTRYSATVIGADPQTDIAVLKIDASGLDYVPVGDSDKLQVGEMVLAIGSPMSERLASTVTQGIVSAKGRSNVGLAEYEDFIQTDAAINPGNSGGPLVNLNGELVGINTAIMSRSGGFQGIGFAVPSNMAMSIMNSLVEEGRVVRGWLGVYIQNVSSEIAEAMGLHDASGALVSDVMEDSPAERAGVQVGDVIVAVDERKIASSSELRNVIASIAPDRTVVLTVRRDDAVRKIDVVLGELASDNTPTGADGEWRELLGFTIAPLDDQVRREHNIDDGTDGVFVTAIDPLSNAYRAGLRQGDVVTSVNQRRVRTVGDFDRILKGREPGDKILLRVARENRRFFVAFAL